MGVEDVLDGLLPVDYLPAGCASVEHYGDGPLHGAPPRGRLEQQQLLSDHASMQAEMCNLDRTPGAPCHGHPQLMTWSPGQ